MGVERTLSPCAGEDAIDPKATMPQQLLHCAQVTGTAVNECSLGSAQQVRPKKSWTQPDVGDPLADQPSILPRHYGSVAITASIL